MSDDEANDVSNDAGVLPQLALSGEYSSWLSCFGKQHLGSHPLIILCEHIIRSSEITLGRMVGQGGFSVVCKIERIDLQDVFDTGEAEHKRRSHFAASTREAHYVLKTLRTDLPEEEYVKGIVDLAIEAEFLSVLDHPNVISMRALANSDPHESKFFVVLDRLTMTLDLKFEKWRKVVGKHSGIWLPCCGYCCCAQAEFLYQTWLERMIAARDIAKAIEYLHSQKIVYRDLKPDNLGFDANGTLKLFDFGLAKRLQEGDKMESGAYMLTGNTGSLRYMAPEVARNEPYNLRVDAYSFSILFWQICSLQTPYAGFSTKQHAEQVVAGGRRPKPDYSWPGSWSDLMVQSWHADPTQRPDFSTISSFLREQVEELEAHEGEVPSRTKEIKAKKKKKKQLVAAAGERLDVDTRLSTKDDTTSRRHDADVV